MSLHDAFRLAEELHSGERKKGTEIPFIYHPVAVASLVLRYGGTESQARAALLHDVASDRKLTEPQLAERFGADVARMAFAFADPELPANGSTPWRQAREAYLGKLREQPAEALFIVACEELHEVSELLHDLRYRGVEVWKRFPVHGMELFWYFRELLQLFNAKLGREPGSEAARPLVSEFGARLNDLRQIVFEGASR